MRLTRAYIVYFHSKVAKIDDVRFLSGEKPPKMTGKPELFNLQLCHVDTKN